MEIDVLIEAYSILKQYVPQKDRQEAADNLISSMVDYLSDQEVKELGAVDSSLRRAVNEYAVQDEDELDFEDE